MPRIPSSEQRALRFSIAASVVFAAISFVLGILFRSQVILFDGLYSLIYVILSWSTLIALKFMRRNDWETFPFGKYTIEPLVVTIRYIALLALILASLVSAIIALFQDGRDIVVDGGLAYAVFATLYCLIMVWDMRRRNAVLNSSFVRAEINEWYLDTIVSAGVVVGFAIAFAMARFAPLAEWVRYVDPIMMIALSIYFFKWPVREIRTSLREVLSMKPEGKLAEEIESVIKSIEQRYRMQESITRVSRVSETVWIEVDFVVTEASGIERIDDQDRIREEIMELIPVDRTQVWLSVGFTKDRKWAV